MARRARDLPEERLAKRPFARRVKFWFAVVASFCGVSGLSVAGVVNMYHDEGDIGPADVRVTSPGYAGGWGPDRTMYPITAPAPFAVLNSISDNPNYGDERNFVTTKLTSQVDAGGWVDDLEVAVGDHVYLRAYYENSADDQYRDTPTSWLQGARVTAGFSPDAGYVAYAWMELSADNAATIWDGVTIHGRERFVLRIVPESTELTTNAHPSGLPLSAEAIVSGEGALVGDEPDAGVVMPGYKDSGFVMLEFEVVAP